MTTTKISKHVRFHHSLASYSLLALQPIICNPKLGVSHFLAYFRNILHVTMHGEHEMSRSAPPSCKGGGGRGSWQGTDIWRQQEAEGCEPSPTWCWDVQARKLLVPSEWYPSKYYSRQPRHDMIMLPHDFTMLPKPMIVPTSEAHMSFFTYRCVYSRTVK